MSTICCPPDYSILFPLIINVSVPNSSTPRNPLCFSGITALLEMIPVNKKKKKDFFLVGCTEISCLLVQTKNSS